MRLEGTNVDNAKKIIEESGLAITSATDLDDAAQKAVKALNWKYLNIYECNNKSTKILETSVILQSCDVDLQFIAF